MPRTNPFHASRIDRTQLWRLSSHKSSLCGHNNDASTRGSVASERSKNTRTEPRSGNNPKGQVHRMNKLTFATIAAIARNGDPAHRTTS
jgi:hypothetical protein